MNEYRVKSTAENIISAHLIWLKWHRSWKFQLRAAAVFFVADLMVFFAIHLLNGGKVSAYALKVGLMGGAIVAVIGPALLHLFLRLLTVYRARKQFRQMKALQVESYISWSDTELSSRSEITQTRHPWSYFLRWGEDENTIALFQSDHAFNVIPKQAIPKQALAALRGYLLAAGVEQIGRPASR